ncbi:MAG TPA: sigma-70 family RNA polymerase sigma factor [Solirubrobacteraceae bacterium]|nr:sigma-70 family RNA polymerase sigma factor [Solirubrobacteraceae bacterium]
MTAVFPGDHDSGIRVLGEARPRRGVPARLLRLASDDRLVEGVRGGSEAAFEALFDRYHRGVLGFCRHMLGSVEEAEDAVQHTFLSAYRELVGSDKHVVLRPWLYTIARNRCLTMLRGRVHQSGGELVEPPTEHLAAAVERRHDLRNLLRDLAGLPEEQRSALVLSEIGDMSHDDIADVLGCRRDKVKALVFQARSSLIASRQARDTPCAEIREQLANLRGGSLRRNDVRRHVSECAGCREFRDAVRAQRRDLALVLPVAPSIGLKSGVVGAALGSAGPTAAATGGGAATSAIVAKVLVAAVIAGGGTVAVEQATDRADRPARTPGETPSSAHQNPSGTSVAPAAPVVTPLRGAAPGPAKLVPPGHAVRDSAPGHARNGQHPAHPAHPAHPGHAANPAAAAEHPGNSANAPGQLKLNGPGKPANTPNASKAEKPVNALKPVRPAKPEKAAKPGKAPKQAKAPKPSAGSAPAKASKPAEAPTPLKAATPAKAPKPALPKPANASKPAEAVTGPEPVAPVETGGKKPK